jgi:hypothetical protein
MPSGDAGPDRWLYGGEDLLATTALNDGWVAVTSHRVVAFDPDADGQPFTAIARPNVAGVRFETAGDDRYLRWGARAGVYGLVTLAGAFVLDATNITSMLAVDAAPSALSSVVSLVSLVAATIRLAIRASLVAGVVLLVVALGLGGLYLQSRQPSFVVERVGAAPARYATTRSEGRRAVAELGAVLDAESRTGRH